ncbi:MAG: hypothetical protein R2862_12315 [Thermoanaerobaculia bacterium]
MPSRQEELDLAAATVDHHLDSGLGRQGKRPHRRELGAPRRPEQSRRQIADRGIPDAESGSRHQRPADHPDPAPLTDQAAFAVPLEGAPGRGSDALPARRRPIELEIVGERQTVGETRGSALLELDDERRRGIDSRQGRLATEGVREIGRVHVGLRTGGDGGEVEGTEMALETAIGRVQDLFRGRRERRQPLRQRLREAFAQPVLPEGRRREQGDQAADEEARRPLPGHRLDRRGADDQAQGRESGSRHTVIVPGGSGEEEAGSGRNHYRPRIGPAPRGDRKTQEEQRGESGKADRVARDPECSGEQTGGCSEQDHRFGTAPRAPQHGPCENSGAEPAQRGEAEQAQREKSGHPAQRRPGRPSAALDERAAEDQGRVPGGFDPVPRGGLGSFVPLEPPDERVGAHRRGKQRQRGVGRSAFPGDDPGEHSARSPHRRRDPGGRRRVCSAALRRTGVPRAGPSGSWTRPRPARRQCPLRRRRAAG